MVRIFPPDRAKIFRTEESTDFIRLKYILDVREFPDSPFAEKVVHDFSVIEQDPEVSIVAREARMQIFRQASCPSMSAVGSCSA